MITGILAGVAAVLSAVVDGTWMPSYHADLLTIRPIGQQAAAARSALPRLAEAAAEGRVWVRPIGIPAPPFGLNETHRMYEGDLFDYVDGPGPYRTAGDGPYTHYVDNTHPAATDDGNPYGTAGRPRRTIPTDLPAGSVVEIHGGPYGPEETVVLARGAADAPVFVRGVGRPRIAGKFTVHNPDGIESRYLVVEGLAIFKIWVIAPASYLSYRRCDVYGDATNGGVGIDSYDSAFSNHHLVFHDNRIHDNGDWRADHDQDVHGIALARRTNHVWIVDNEFYHNSGDGVQINAQSKDLQPYTHHIYLGRNRSHHNKQAGLWTKQATDVIFSQNTVYGLRPLGAKPSAYGSGMGFQYGPQRVWFLYNHVYDCCYGISSGSTSGMGRGLDTYYIGNLIHDIHHDPGYPYTPDSAWSNAGIALSGTINKYVIGNTIVNCDAGINSSGPGRLVMVDNVIANVTESRGNHVFVALRASAAVSLLSRCLLYQGGQPARIRWGTARVYSLPAFQLATGNGMGCRMVDPTLASAAGPDHRSLAADRMPGMQAVSRVYATFQRLYGVNIRADIAAGPRVWPTALERTPAMDMPVTFDGDGRPRWRLEARDRNPMRQGCAWGG